MEPSGAGARFQPSPSQFPWFADKGNCVLAASLFDHGEFIGAEGATIGSSTDGMTWSIRQNQIQLPTANAHAHRSVAFKNSILFFGPDGTVHQSGAWRDFIGEWKARQFSAAELEIDALSGDTADPDADGLDNLLEYALKLDPRTADAGGDVVFHAGPHFDPDAASSFLMRAVLPSWSSAPGIRVWAETSTGLAYWRRDNHRSSMEWAPSGMASPYAISFTRSTNDPSAYLRVRAARATHPAGSAP